MEILPYGRRTLIDELLVEILIRLPESKTVVQLKLVSRQWNFIISSPYFISRCNDYHRPKADSFTLLFQYCFDSDVSYFFPEPILSTASGNKRLNLDFIPKIAALSSSHYLLAKPVPEIISIKASFKDLLLLSCHNNTDFYVVNPQIRHWISLPPPPRRDKKTNFKYGLLCKYTFTGLRYKVIRIPYFLWYSNGIGSDDFSVEIFCSESKQWCEYSVDWYPCRLNSCLLRNPIVSNNGTFHWVNGVSLVSLDPFNLVVIRDRLRPNRIIELPGGPLVVKPLYLNHLHSNANLLLGFGVSLGRLYVITRVDSCQSSLRVWQLDEKASGKRWRLVIKVPFNSPIKDKLVRLYRSFLAFHPYRSDVIFSVNKYILQINLRTQCSKYLNQDDEHGVLIGWLRPPGPQPLLHQWLPTTLTS